MCRLDLQRLYGNNNERDENEDGSEISRGGKRGEITWFLACGKSEKGLMRKGMKVNADKRKVMVLNGEEGLEYDICVDGLRFEHMSQ